MPSCVSGGDQPLVSPGNSPSSVSSLSPHRYRKLTVSCFHLSLSPCLTQTPAERNGKPPHTENLCCEKQAPGSPQDPTTHPGSRCPDPHPISLPRFLSFCRAPFLPPSNTGLWGCIKKGKPVKWGEWGEWGGRVSQHYPLGLVPQKAFENIQKSPQAVTGS